MRLSLRLTPAMCVSKGVGPPKKRKRLGGGVLPRQLEEALQLGQAWEPRRGSSRWIGLARRASRERRSRRFRGDLGIFLSLSMVPGRVVALLFLS